MDLLARREHSRYELRRKLERRFDLADIEEALSGLAEEGLQSDARFAESFTRERILRAFGPRRIRAELQQRRVDDDLIDRAIREVPIAEAVSWSGLAAQALQRRFGDQPAADAREKARRHRYLYQRGFAVEDISGE